MLCFQLQHIGRGSRLSLCSPRVVYNEQPESWLSPPALAEPMSSAPVVAISPVERIEMKKRGAPPFPQERRRYLPPIQCEVMQVFSSQQEVMQNTYKDDSMARQGTSKGTESKDGHTSAAQGEMLFLYRQTSAPLRGLVLVTELPPFLTQHSM